MTIYLIAYDDRDFFNVDYDLGYFTDKAAAEAEADRLNRKEYDDARRRAEKNHADRRARYIGANAARKALEDAGIKPTYDNGGHTYADPGEFVYPEYKNKGYYELYEIDAHPSVKEN